MAITLFVAYVLTLVYLTVAALYPGTGFVRPYGPTEQPVQATVEECRRVGPVSRQGLGYRSICRILLQRDGGPAAEVVVGGSIADPEKVGRVVTLREACAGPGRNGCRYGKPVATIWSLLYGIFRILGKVLGVFLLLMSLIYLFRAFVGAPTYFSLLDRWRSGKGNSSVMSLDE